MEERDGGREEDKEKGGVLTDAALCGQYWISPAPLCQLDELNGSRGSSQTTWALNVPILAILENN